VAKVGGAKAKGRAAPRIDAEALTDTFRQQMESGRVSDAVISEERLRSLQSARMERCVLRAVSLSAPEAERLRLTDTRMESSDLANANLTGGVFERVEFYETRLTGISLNEARLKSVLWQECELDFALFRMARLEQCVFERCNLTEADFYGADLYRHGLSRLRLQPGRPVPGKAGQRGYPRLPAGRDARHTVECRRAPHQSGSGDAVDHALRRARGLVMLTTSSGSMSDFCPVAWCLSAWPYAMSGKASFNVIRLFRHHAECGLHLCAELFHYPDMLIHLSRCPSRYP
jgi:hypothetical protein